MEPQQKRLMKKTKNKKTRCSEETDHLHAGVWYWRQTAGINGATPMPPGVWWWMKKRPLVATIALCFLQCFDTTSWVTGRTFGQ